MEDFRDHPNLHPIGIQIDPHDKTQCYLFFHHDVPYCGTSMTIHSGNLPESMTHPITTMNFRGSVCPGYCSNLDEMTQCPGECTVEKYRRLMLEIGNKQRALRIAAGI
jgi:hypothetical protein